MPNFRFTLNGKPCELELPDGSVPLLWILRDTLGLTGTKYGCGIDQCGACTVHIDGKAVRSCSSSIESVQGRSVVTIEGLAHADGRLHPVQQAWVDHDVSQCGYCQPGQIMQAAALLHHNPKPSDADIDAVMKDNLCRCGTYPRIRAAIHTAAAHISSGKGGAS